jgi:hypothetical protein
VRDRYAQADDPSLHVALVRVFRLPAPWTFPMEKRFGGCRSWIDLPAPPAGWRDQLTPVLDDDAFSRLARQVRECGLE